MLQTEQRRSSALKALTAALQGKRERVRDPELQQLGLSQLWCSMIVQFYWQPGPVLCVWIVRAIRSSKQIEARVQTSCLQLGAVGTEDFRKVLKATTPEAPHFESGFLPYLPRRQSTSSESDLGHLATQTT